MPTNLFGESRDDLLNTESLSRNIHEIRDYLHRGWIFQEPLWCGGLLQGPTGSDGSTGLDARRRALSCASIHYAPADLLLPPPKPQYQLSQRLRKPAERGKTKEPPQTHQQSSSSRILHKFCGLRSIGLVSRSSSLLLSLWFLFYSLGWPAVPPLVSSAWYKGDERGRARRSRLGRPIFIPRSISLPSSSWPHQGPFGYLRPRVYNTRRIALIYIYIYIGIDSANYISHMHIWKIIRKRFVLMIKKVCLFVRFSV